MERTDFMDRIGKALLIEADFKKTGDIEAEAIGYYADKISKAITPLNEEDVPFVITALDKISESMKKAYPVASEYAKELNNSIESEMIVVQSTEAVFNELLKELGGKLWN